MQDYKNYKSEIEGQQMTELKVFICALGVVAMFTLWCIAMTMDYNDQVRQVPKASCEDRSAEWGRETVEVCGSKSKPLTKIVGH